MKKQLLPEIPAGLDSLEIFRSGNYLAKAVYMGTVMHFSDLPIHIRDWFSLDLLRDKRALRLVRSILPLDASADAVLEAFVSCRYGNFDNKPDLDQRNRLNPDAPCCGCEQFCAGFNKICRVPGNIRLSPSEYTVIRYVSLGLTDDEIASEMNLSIHSVRSYLERIRTKLDFNNRVQIALWAHKHNI
jgi:DNA-binding CsgD family transcriptional regulator